MVRCKARKKSKTDAYQDIREGLDFLSNAADRHLGAACHASGHSPAAISRSLYFWILPLAVMG